MRYLMFSVRGILGTLGVLLLTLCQPAPTSDEGDAESTGAEMAGDVRFYVGTGNGTPDSAIFVGRLDTAGGMYLERVIGGLRNPTFLDLSPQHDLLYAIHSVPDQRESGVSAFGVDPGTGALRLLNQVSAGGRGACYVSVSPDGRWVINANYGDGTVAAHEVAADGSLGRTYVVQHEGSSINPQRQEGPHAHYAAFGKGGLVYAADLGTDKVMLYELLENQGLMPAEPAFLEVEPGSGPRHLDAHPRLPVVYLLNELSGTVTVFRHDAEAAEFETLQTISNLPQGFEGANKSADIHVHPSGKFLYASNRGDANGICVYAIDPQTGTLKVVEHEMEGIVWPRNFGLSPSGDFLLVANKNDHSIVSFSVNPDTGALTPTGHRLPVPSPMCIKFVPGA